MSGAIPKLDSDQILLAAYVAKAFTSIHRLAYAQIGADLRIIHVSPNFRFLADQIELEVIAKPVTEWFWLFIGAEDVLHDMLNGKLPLFEIKNVHYDLSDGTTAYLNFQLLPIQPENPNQGLLLIVEDVSSVGNLQHSLVQERNELRLLQLELGAANKELQRLNQLKSLFLAMAAHDLRTPLTAIHGYASLLREMHLDAPHSREFEYLNSIVSQSDHLNFLINNMLDLDQIERGTFTVVPDNCIMQPIIMDVVQGMQLITDRREMQLTIDIPDTPLIVRAESERIRQIIYNLLSNAHKYTPRGGKIRIKAIAENDTDMLLEISDTGQGMTPEQVNSLFQPYYRTQDARQSNIKGTGLGLFIVKSTIEAHGGQISVTSKVDEGTTFSIRLPLGHRG